MSNIASWISSVIISRLEVTVFRNW